MKSKATLVAEIIRSQNGKAVTVKFKKKTDGTMRVLNGRLGVKKNIKGEGLAFDPKDYKLLSIYDMQNHGYRFINLPEVRWIKAGSITHRFKVTK